MCIGTDDVVLLLSVWSLVSRFRISCFFLLRWAVFIRMVCFSIRIAIPPCLAFDLFDLNIL